MPSRRAPYVKPQVLQFEYKVDPRVTLAFSCKGTQAGSGQFASACEDQFGAPCSDTAGS